MDVNFHCLNPLNTVARVMDIARSMSVDFDRLTLQRDECGQFVVNVVLSSGDPALHKTFITKLQKCHDLIKDRQDV